MHAVGVVLHPARDPAEAVKAVLGWAQRGGADVYGIADEIVRLNCEAKPLSAEELARRSDLLVSIGGDGTMLRTMRLADGQHAPVLGVNLGKLGFLAEVDVPELPAALSAIDEHEFIVEPRLAIDCYVTENGGTEHGGVKNRGIPTGSTGTCVAENGTTASEPTGIGATGAKATSTGAEPRPATVGGRRATAFNDIAVVRIPGDKLAAIAVHVGGQLFVSYVADAVIVATPTGSTAYSFSAGGPIVSPSVEALLITPAAPHSAYNRGVVLSVTDTVSLELLPESGRLAIEVDGRVVGYAHPGDFLDITPRPGAARVVRLGHTTFYQRARRKLGIRGSAVIEQRAKAESRKKISPEA